MTIDLRDMDNIREIHRVEGIFPYDAYQVIDDPNIWLTGFDTEEGMIIGYVEIEENKE